ncbi:MAG: hypothetical protein JNL82_24005 [Myxococcales bacterium]|nr:hypothetical protein [Myxococcales bacterium]
MHHTGIYGAARGLGSTLLAAHLYYYLREHGVYCGAASRGFRGGRPLGLTRWADISSTAGAPLCKQTLLRPLGFGVHISDLHAELFAAELGENACESWVIPIRDEASLERGLQIAPHLQGSVLLVWNGADDAVRRRVSLPFGRVAIAASALPKSDLLRRADEALTPIWRLPGGAGSTAGRAMIRVLREILARTAVTLDSAARVIGGQPPAPAVCGRCSLCELTQQWTTSATWSTGSTVRRAASEDDCRVSA